MSPLLCIYVCDRLRYIEFSGQTASEGTVGGDRGRSPRLRNDLCRDWLPYMTSLGYKAVAVGVENAGENYCGDLLELEKNNISLFDYCETDKERYSGPIEGFAECDILWVRSDVQWQEVAALPLVAETELFQFKWIAGPHANQRISKIVRAL